MIVINTNRPIVYNSSTTGLPYAKYSAVVRCSGNFVVDPSQDPWSRMLARSPNSGAKREMTKKHQNFDEDRGKISIDQPIFPQPLSVSQLKMLPFGALALKAGGAIAKTAAKKLFKLDIDKIMSLIE